MKESMEAQFKGALESIHKFLESKTCYDVLPVSFKLVMLDSTLTLKGALLTLLQNGVISAPIWNSKECSFSGLLTAHDFVNALRLYIDKPKVLNELAHIRLNDLDHIESQVGSNKLDAANVNPHLPLSKACEVIMKSRAHRVALVDEDPVSKRKIVVSVLTQYRLLRFVALNCKETKLLQVSVKDLKLGSYGDLSTTTMDAPLKEVVDTLSKTSVSAIPVIDHHNKLVNMYELYDLMHLIKANGSGDLDMTVGEALMRRQQDFSGVLTCRSSDTLSDLMEIIRRSRLLRVYVVNESGKLEGVITLSDITRFICSGTNFSFN